MRRRLADDLGLGRCDGRRHEHGQPARDEHLVLLGRHLGHLDVLAPTLDVQVVSILPGQGDGAFGEYVPLLVGQGPYDSVVADMNADGIPDLLTAGGAVSVLPSRP